MPATTSTRTPPLTRSGPVETIYADAWKQINRGNWGDAAKQFDEVDRQHPYSVWARRAMLMSAFCSPYQDNQYDTAVSTADQYISLHPGSQEVAYAFYLKALSLYEQIVDVGRDQSKTEGALVALQDCGAAFSRYGICPRRDPEDRPDHGPSGGQGNGGGPLLSDAGRLYRRHQPLKVVVVQYQTTPQIAEALERLTEANYALGLNSEAQTAAAGAGRQLSRQPMVHRRL